MKQHRIALPPPPPTLIGHIQELLMRKPDLQCEGVGTRVCILHPEPEVEPHQTERPSHTKYGNWSYRRTLFVSQRNFSAERYNRLSPSENTHCYSNILFLLNTLFSQQLRQKAATIASVTFGSLNTCGWSVACS